MIWKKQRKENVWKERGGRVWHLELAEWHEMKEDKTETVRTSG